MESRRRLLLVTGLMFLGGCGLIRKPRRVDDKGRFCFRAGKSRNQTCTPSAVPSEQKEAEVKRFEPDSDRLTVFVVRKRWADTQNQLDFRVGSAPPVTTVPDSFVRVRLAPGAHTLLLTWEGKDATIAVQGKAGEVRFVEIVGSLWAWGSSYGWSSDDQNGARERARASRLIALPDDLR